MEFEFVFLADELLGRTQHNGQKDYERDYRKVNDISEDRDNDIIAKNSNAFYVMEILL